MPGPRGNAAIQKGKGFRAANPMKTFKRILTYLKPFKGRLIIVLLGMLVNVVANIAGTLMIGTAIDSYIVPLVYGKTVTLGSLSGLAALGGYVAIMAAAFLVSALAQYVANFLLVSATTKILENVRNEMFEKMEKLPIKYFDTHTHHYPEINSYKVRAGSYLTTLSAYDYATHHFTNGAAHAGGGMISFLYKDGVGPIVAGSIYDYKLTEPNNMQRPIGGVAHASLLMRAEYETDGVKYATCLDRAPVIFISSTKSGEIVAIVKSHFRASDNSAIADNDLASFSYLFDASGVTIRIVDLPQNARFVLPIVRGAGRVVTENAYEKRPIFFLPGGFAADEYTFSGGEDLTIKIV